MSIGDFWYNLYKVPKSKLRAYVISNVIRIEKGVLYSQTLRRIFRDFHQIDVGMYSMGGCFNHFQISAHTTIGRYCSFAPALRIMNRNHPVEYKSTHGLFFNPALGFCEKDNIEFIPLKIGNDVWIGHNAIVMPNVTTIGDGAVIGGGAVVNKDIPPYAIAVGNPARVVRYRFPPEVIKQLLKERWWEKSIDELKNEAADFTRVYHISTPENSGG